ncbi:mitochondrial 54S ribosomal mL60 domain-containing protein NDAI_0E01980 [Naumovozyma dairenensis CBS 421]|uniref:54S ribosomal protein L31, mitochondrial n=1 Tax=Naumovozyma dairenensis (strain ATCC 10597 / BCRC 20456 / CBS 421 / NBRC 0211 / NRRL Y-12639) TaxID=1071378 RepID=G0WB94_NAUDC|nr:hypothetical protein NDAI_0E01980 [Naumovozyma dairenensis CBS 421]CCD25014.1 hypothetical protein NDAI_0E01980 [Naumovozyma dairenensis CBS 421]
MFGAFKSTSPSLGGLLWKIPWRLSSHQKYRQRNRLKHVDEVIKQITTGLHVMRCEDKGIEYKKAISMPKKQMFKPRMASLRLLNKSSFFPKEFQMSSKDKYTVFDKKVKGYRKGIHKVPKWTKISMRQNPKFF